MKRYLLFLPGFLFFSEAHAAENSDSWKWYYTAFPGLSAKPDPFIRFGTAEVSIKGETLKIKLDEPRDPHSIRPSYLGTISKKGDIKGNLQKFFLDGDNDGMFQYGKYEYMELPGDPPCRIEQILLKSGNSDGSILMFAREGTRCYEPRQRQPDHN